MNAEPTIRALVLELHRRAQDLEDGGMRVPTAVQLRAALAAAVADIDHLVERVADLGRDPQSLPSGQTQQGRQLHLVAEPQNQDHHHHERVARWRGDR